LHITEIEDDEEEEEIDVMELMDNDEVLRSVRTHSKEIRDLRSELKKSRKDYNILRDKLRQRRREHVSKALKEFRDQSRQEFRAVQDTLVKKATEVFTAEKDAYITLTSELTYDNLPWKEYHEAEGQGAQFKINAQTTRHTDPWNSSFWYA
jgi:DNA gyrase/topoisomerase IV subunit A